MLEKVRKPGRAKAITAYIIFGAICLVFIFMGLSPNSSNFGSGGAAAQVNGQAISQKDFRSAFRRRERRMGDQINTLPYLTRQRILDNMRIQTLEELILRKVVTQSAMDLGVMVTDKEVQQQIVDLPFLQKEGRFQRNLYNNLLRNIQMSSSEYERQLRDDLVVGRLRQAFELSLDAMASDRKLDAQAQLTTLDVDYLELDKETLEKKVKPKKAEVSQFLASHEEEAKKYYEKNKKNYKEEEKVKASHILFLVDSKDPLADEKALKKATELLKELTPENFEKLAKKHSEDVSTRLKGGKLGFFKRGDMASDFERAVFAEKVGLRANPLRTKLGYHLVYIKEKTGGETQEYKVVSQKVARILLKKDLGGKGVEQLKGLLKKEDNPSKALDKFIKDFDLKWANTGEFHLGQQNVPRLGDNPKVMDEILTMKKKGEMSSELVESRGKYYLVRIKELNLPSKEALQKRTAEDLEKFRSEASGLDRASEVLNSWAETEKEQSSISRSGAIVGGAQEPAAN